MSGFGRALPVHAVVGLALQLVLLVQVGAAVLLWRQGRAPAWVAGVSIALFVIVLLQNAVGHNRQYWLHVPTGVALVGALNRQRSSLDTLRRTTGVRS
jgi:membrane protein YdbS with pleckstrin-like domain